MPPKGKLPDAGDRRPDRMGPPGAPWPETPAAARRPTPRRSHWAFQPVADPAPPRVKDEGWPRRRSTASSWRSWKREGSAPSPAADRRTLIRRATFDLIGLPPTPEEVAAFEADPSRARGASRRSSIACSPRPITASAGAATGSTSPAMPTRRATSSTEERELPLGLRLSRLGRPLPERGPALRPVPHPRRSPPIGSRWRATSGTSPRWGSSRSAAGS